MSKLFLTKQYLIDQLKNFKADILDNSYLSSEWESIVTVDIPVGAAGTEYYLSKAYSDYLFVIEVTDGTKLQIVCPNFLIGEKNKICGGYYHSSTDNTSVSMNVKYYYDVLKSYCFDFDSLSVTVNGEAKTGKFTVTLYGRN